MFLKGEDLIPRSTKIEDGIEKLHKENFLVYQRNRMNRSENEKEVPKVTKAEVNKVQQALSPTQENDISLLGSPERDNKAARKAINMAMISGTDTTRGKLFTQKKKEFKDVLRLLDKADTLRRKLSANQHYELGVLQGTKIVRPQTNPLGLPEVIDKTMMRYIVADVKHQMVRIFNETVILGETNRRSTLPNPYKNKSSMKVVYVPDNVRDYLLSVPLGFKGDLVAAYTVYNTRTGKEAKTREQATAYMPEYYHDGQYHNPNNPKPYYASEESGLRFLRTNYVIKSFINLALNTDKAIARLVHPANQVNVNPDDIQISDGQRTYTTAEINISANAFIQATPAMNTYLRDELEKLRLGGKQPSYHVPLRKEDRARVPAGAKLNARYVGGDYVIAQSSIFSLRASMVDKEVTDRPDVQEQIRANLDDIVLEFDFLERQAIKFSTWNKSQKAFQKRKNEEEARPKGAGTVQKVGIQNPDPVHVQTTLDKYNRLTETKASPLRGNREQ